MHPPRPGKKLLVLDLDYTILDCKNISERENLHGKYTILIFIMYLIECFNIEHKRPYLEEFMVLIYECKPNSKFIRWPVIRIMTLQCGHR